MTSVSPNGEFPGGPTVLRLLLGNQLRMHREASGISTEAAGYEIRASRSKISRMENGRVSFKERDVCDLLTLYGVTDESVLGGLLSLARQANAQGWWTRFGDVLPDWFDAYLGLEEGAALIRIYELQFVHGLFQTEDYARSVTGIGRQDGDRDEIERRVSVRMQRQRLLSRPEPPRLWAVMDEAALRRPVGGRAVMRGQIEHLLEVAELPHVTLQIMPFSRGSHAAAGGSFTILRFGEPDLPDVVYIEQLTSALYLEKREDLDYYLEVMDRVCSESATPTASLMTLADIRKTM
ncbi:MAG TPA: helix-turn-helix transcriptional regulator [Streptosporangiaceae bacterium]|jgi:transcriptional regulator with XRE-family HTH domain|nr:helix-turn-helix transcriptional regulator [Streptosporangiaceae bacterium]